MDLATFFEIIDVMLVVGVAAAGMIYGLRRRAKPQDSVSEAAPTSEVPASSLNAEVVSRDPAPADRLPDGMGIVKTDDPQPAPAIEVMHVQDVPAQVDDTLSLSKIIEGIPKGLELGEAEILVRMRAKIVALGSIKEAKIVKLSVVGLNVEENQEKDLAESPAKSA